MKPEGEPQDYRVCEFYLAFISLGGDGLERAGAWHVHFIVKKANFCGLI